MILNDRPVLVNASGNWTVHEYFRSEVVTGVNEEGEPTVGVTHWYRCTVTGAERRYGFEAPYLHGIKDSTRHA